jgi:hypothetical protein
MKNFRLSVLFSILSLLGSHGAARAADWLYLPEQPWFRPLVADPREIRGSLTTTLQGNRLDAAIGKILPILRYQGENGDVEWGIHAAAFPYLKQQDLKFPMQENDWWFGTYLSGGKRLCWRLDYTHVSSHLGDALFSKENPIVYSREFVRFLESTRRGPFRFYVGPGVLVHTIPKEKAFFLQTGLEWTSGKIGRDGHWYAAWDFKAKQEADGVANHALQAGWQFGDAEKGRTVRFGLTYFHGHSENGQFFLTTENRLSGGVFFDP